MPLEPVPETEQIWLRLRYRVRAAGEAASGILPLARLAPYAFELRSILPRLHVSYDRLSAVVGDTVTCQVKAERVGFRGYGMLLAEVGLPPGAEVDRRSLEDTVQTGGWGLNHYDILPDRVVAYIWPQAGGTGFSFRFRPRFAVRAKTAPSSLYDYYNPDSRVTLPPASFQVGSTAGRLR